MVDRLADDHARARRLAEALADRFPGWLDPDRVETNIVCADSALLPDAFVDRLAARRAGRHDRPAHRPLRDAQGRRRRRPRPGHRGPRRRWRHRSDRRSLLVDASSLLYRAFYSTPDTVTAPDGSLVNAVHGFLNMLSRLIVDHRPDRVACATDEDWRPAWRVELVPEYKLARVAGPATAPGPSGPRGRPPGRVFVLRAGGRASACPSSATTATRPKT